MQETQEKQVQPLGQENPLEKKMATHSSILVWKIPWTEEPGGLQSMGSQRVRHTWVCIHTQSIYIDSLYENISPVLSHFLIQMRKLKTSKILKHLALSLWILPSKSLLCYVLSLFSHVQLCVTPWTVALQAPLSMGFSRKEYWRGLLCLSPRDLPNLGIESRFVPFPALADSSLPNIVCCCCY